MSDDLLPESAYTFFGASGYVSDHLMASLHSQIVGVLSLEPQVVFMTIRWPPPAFRECVCLRLIVRLCFRPSDDLFTLTDRGCAFAGSSGYVSDRSMTPSCFQGVRMSSLEYRVVFLTVRCPLYTHRMCVYFCWSGRLCFWPSDYLLLLDRAYTFVGVLGWVLTVS